MQPPPLAVIAHDKCHSTFGSNSVGHVRTVKTVQPLCRAP